MTGRLHERSAELATLDQAVLELSAGRGGAILVEAMAGRGKSALIEYAVSTSREAGARTLLARARHLESAAPYEILRRLLGPAVEELGGASTLTGAAAFAAPLFTPGAALVPGVDYGCQWLIAAMAERMPLLLAVDDAHWADAASLRVLLEVLAEISVQPVLLLLGSRPVENADAQRRLASMAAQPDCRVLTPGRLSRDGVGAVVAEALGEPAADGFIDDCYQVSGGNAFYLRELLRPYQAVFREDLQSVIENGSMSLQRTMTWRLGELGAAATSLARAAAVLGDGASLRVAADLAGLDAGVALSEAPRLEAASVFGHGDPIEFVHPLVRAAVERTLTDVEIGDLHSRAARLLRAGGTPPSVVVQHLVASPAAGDADVAGYLAAQGKAALDTGAMAVAAQLLRRALAEPPPPEDRGPLLLRTARAEHAIGAHDEAVMRLEEALAMPEREVSLQAAAELHDVMSDAGRFAELPSLNKRILELQPTGASEAEVRLRAYLLNDVVLAADPTLIGLPAEYHARPTGDLPTERGVDRLLLVATALYERTMRGGSSAAQAAHLDRALRDLPPHDQLTRSEAWSALTAAAYLADDELDEADRVLDRLTPAVARLSGGEPALQAELEHRRNLIALRRGSFEDALTGVDRAEEYVRRRRLTGYDGDHEFTRAWVAFERGEYESAGRLLADMDSNVLVYRALGELLLGHPRDAIAQLESYGVVLGTQGDIRQVEVEFEPHLIASHAFQSVGDRSSAQLEADREVFIRRQYGPRFRLALALRRQAVFTPARQAIPLLEEAVELAESTPRRPVLVRVLTTYGSALARTAQAAEARTVLYRAIDEAAGMGMARLETRARQALAGAGGRPRRARTSGPTSLTDAQLKVAQLAARRSTNREIAEELFVTIKTVETHLQAVYRKLGIDGRDALLQSLTSTSSPAGRDRVG